ncbi:MAG TPA: hypothetical protein VLS89_13830 [Candidatus Nanopelagicales bacterium]|nr:hypothetical protein [Candidatus Nanopelagicales bacterium]
MSGLKTAQDVERFLEDMDRFPDTAEPEDEADADTASPEDPDTADPDGVEDDLDDPDAGDDDEDTAGPAARISARGALRLFLNKNGGRMPTQEQLPGLLAHVYKKGAKRRPRLRIPPQVEVKRPLTPNVLRFRNRIFGAVNRLHNRKTVTSKGYYYSTSEVVFTGVGDVQGAALSLSPTTIRFFHEAIDDNVLRLVESSGGGGIAHKVTPGETNLQYPGKNLYPREVFVISHVGIEFCGMRVMFDPGDLQPLPIDPQIKDLLSGNGTIWDDGQVFLPGALLNDFDGRCLLVDSLFPTGVLYFVWDKKQVGGNRDVQELLISTLQRIPVTRMGLNETSGGANLLEMHEGYVWSLDQQTSAGRAGIFEARIRTHERVMFPIKPVDIGGSFLVPRRLSVLLRMTVYGDAIRPVDDLVQAPERRMR